MVPTWLTNQDECANIFGANWLIPEWYPSRQLVWLCGDDLDIALHNDFFLRACVIFSYATENNLKIIPRVKDYYNLSYYWLSLLSIFCILNALDNHSKVL